MGVGPGQLCREGPAEPPPALRRPCQTGSSFCSLLNPIALQHPVGRREHGPGGLTLRGG